MARARKASEQSLSGPTLGSRFALTMTISLAVVMAAAGFFLYNRMSGLAQAVQEKAFVEAAALQDPYVRWEMAMQHAKDLSIEPDASVKPVAQLTPLSNREVITYPESDVKRYEVVLGDGKQTPAYAYKVKDSKVPLIVPANVRDRAAEGLLALIAGVTLAVILVGAVVAYAVGGSVARPLELIVNDIATISRGDLRHRTRVRAGGEVMLLAKSIDRMAGNLEAAQEAQLELSVRARELALASEVREALLPEGTPDLPGCEISALYVECASPGGTFHEFVELEGGRVGLLVCDVSGRGIPGAMIGAIARSYLRVELGRTGDVSEAMQRVNRELARDVRRGMFVTAMYVLVDPKENVAIVACAGHKVPLIRYTSADKKIRLVHPEGIALGFDKGPVFAKTLQIVKVPVEPGDRLVIANVGAVQVTNKAGAELGDKEFYRLVLQHANQPTEAMLERIKGSLTQYAEGRPFPNDISIVSLVRKA